MFRQRNWSSLSTIVSLTAAALIMAITIAGAGTAWAAIATDGSPLSNELQPPAPDDRLTTQVPSTAGPIVDPSMTVTREDVVSARTNNWAPAKMNRQMTPEITIEASRNPYVAGLGDLTFTLTRTGDTASALDVTVNLSQDQTWLSATSSAVMFAAGASTSTLSFRQFDFSTDVTQSGTLTATVDAVSGYDTGNATVSVSVISQDGPAVTVSFEKAEYSVAENAGSLEVVLVAQATTSVPYVPDFWVLVITDEIEASNTDDFAELRRIFLFDSSKFVDVDGSLVGEVSIVLTIADDEIREGDERFELQFSRVPTTPLEVGFLDPGGTLCDVVCQDHYPVTILDDDPNVSVSFEQDSYDVAEGSSVTVKVTLSADPERTVYIPILLTEQGGASVSDYGVVSEVEVVEFSLGDTDDAAGDAGTSRYGPFNPGDTDVAAGDAGTSRYGPFNPGDTEKTLTIDASQDFWNDDGESLLLGFGELPDGVTAGMYPTSTVTIIDDDDGDPAFSVGGLGAFWTHPDSRSGNLLVGSCSGLEAFRIIWDAREDLRGADEWDAHFTRFGGMNLVSHSFRESPGLPPGHYEMNGTANMEGEGHLSIRVRGLFGSDGWGEWSPAVGLFCLES